MKAKEKIILIGGGGHCKSVIDIIEVEEKYEIAGIIDIKEKIGTSVLGYPIIGCDDDITSIAKQYTNFVITFGQGKTNDFRLKTYHLLKSLNVSLPVIYSPYTHVSGHAQIGEGTVVMHGCIVNAGAKVGVNCILNTQSLIEHDAVVGNHCHISTKVSVNGFVSIGNNVFAGSSSVFVDRVSVCDDVTFGAGTVITKSIMESGIYVGNPAKKTT
jgi:sugar O-acyltransferase (sialic acid O-acetyltransferase NeuD family)